MSRPKIIATQISNLTDARYFAAQGVDFLLFDSSVINIEKMIEIREWIEGPAILLAVQPGHVERLDEYILRIGAIAIDTTNYKRGEADHLQGHILSFEWRNKVLHFEGVEYHIWNHKTKTALSRSGVILYGSPEDETGMKSFDALDDFFELIQS